MELDVDDLKLVIHEALDERDRMDAQQHQLHHQYIADRIVREKKREERREALRRQILGWGTITAIGGLGYLILEGVKHWLHLQ